MLNPASGAGWFGGRAQKTFLNQTHFWQTKQDVGDMVCRVDFLLHIKICATQDRVPGDSETTE